MRARVVLRPVMHRPGTMRAGTVRLGATQRVQAMPAMLTGRYGVNLPGKVSGATLVQQFGGVPCVKDQSYGWTDFTFWTKNGCSGVFDVEYDAATVPPASGSTTQPGSFGPGASGTPIPGGSVPFFPGGGLLPTTPTTPNPYGQNPIAGNPVAPPAAPPGVPVVPVCGIDWANEAAKIRTINNRVRNCETVALPAEIICPTGSDMGTGSRADYLAARQEYQAAVEYASVMCAAPTTNTGGSTGSTGSTGGGSYPYPGYDSGYGSGYGYGQQPQQGVLPADPAFRLGRGGKAAIGVGGVALLAGGIFLIMRRRKKNRRA